MKAKLKTGLKIIIVNCPLKRTAVCYHQMIFFLPYLEVRHSASVFGSDNINARRMALEALHDVSFV
jgi:hypothetical protein